MKVIVYVVFLSEYGDRDVVCVADTERRSRQEARRVMQPGADHWHPHSPRPHYVAQWECPGKPACVTIERHEVLKSQDGDGS